MTPEQRIQTALMKIRNYGDVDGAHHKQYCLDQVVRILTGCPRVVKTGFHNGETYTYSVLGESEEYLKWVAFTKDGEDGPDTYEWDIGSPP